MDETELEEGEALTFHEGNEDSAIDPDINSLSYIEEKIQCVLGHFQKDFEGGVSAENLGAKFGGYGSFLPTHQRSPSWSHSRSSAEVVQNSQRSPQKDQKKNSLSLVRPSVRSSTASGKAISAGNMSEGKGKSQSGYADKWNAENGSDAKSVNNLKLRIKVGSENLSMQKTVDIYSGLGLESPSSSFDGSPSTSEGQFIKSLDMPDESPTSILQIMTSFPGDALLSPLSEDLICLTTKLRGKHESRTIDRPITSFENSDMLINGWHSSKSEEKIPEAKGLRSSENFKASAIEPSEQTMGIEDKNFSLLRRENEADVDALVCEEIISNTLKLPLLSSSEFGTGDSGKNTTIDTKFSAPNIKDGISGETLSSSNPAQDTGRVGKSSSRVGSLGNVSEREKRKHLGTNAANSLMDIQMAEVSHALDVPDLIVPKVEGPVTAAETSVQAKKLVFHGGRSVGAEGFKPFLVSSFNGDEKRRKVTLAPGSQGAYSKKVESAVESSMNEHEKMFGPYTPVRKNNLQEPTKDLGKITDRYKDFFGDEVFEDEDDDDDDDNHESHSREGIFGRKLKGNHPSSKTSFSKGLSVPVEKCKSKSSGNPQSERKHPKICSHVADNGPSTEAPTGVQPMVNEHWVICDKCQIWRLLPLGTDPNSLPDKWTCDMLTWLPGMNRCFIPEEKTTNALRALYHPAVPPDPTSESQHMGIPMVAPGHPGQEHQSVVVRTAANNGKKKNGPIKGTHSTGLDGSTRSSSSRKKSLCPTGKGSSLNGGNSSSSPDSCRYQLPVQLSSGAGKFENIIRKDPVTSCFDKGAHIHVKSKQESVMEGCRVSKKVEGEELHFDDDKWITKDAGSPLKGDNASTSFSYNTSEKKEGRENRNRTDSSAVDKVSDMNLEASGPIAGYDLIHSGKREKKDVARKRKSKELCFSEIHSESDEKDTFKKRKAKEHRFPDIHSEKRAEFSKLTKEFSAIKSGVEAGCSEGLQDEPHMLYAGNNQASDFLKSDLGLLKPPVAANSSSSKVSGSHKNKMGGQEVKGSPVESVSSSPLRYPDPDKVSSTVKNLVGKFDIEECGPLTALSPRRLLSDGGCHGQTGLPKEMDGLACTSNISNFNGQLGQIGLYFDQRKVEGQSNTGKFQDTGFVLKKSGKGTAFCHDLDKVSNRASDSSHDSLAQRNLIGEKSKSRRNKFDDKSATGSKGGKITSREDTARGMENENGKASRRLVNDCQDAIKDMDEKQNSLGEHVFEKISKKSDVSEVHRNVKSDSLPPYARVSTEATATECVNISPADAFDSGNIQKTQSQKMKAEKSNGPARHPAPNSCKVRDADAPSPVRRESSSSSHVANALKEATDLKHTADRMKKAGSPESYGLYFQSALKFLHGSSLMESGGSEAVKHNEMHSTEIYRSTAPLFEYCAREYEKLKNIAAAALAYKCAEVAYMRVVYSSNPSASRDRNELQSALQIPLPGESPSSSASDVDNLNHQAAPEKGPLSRVVNSPQVSGNHVISSHNRAGLLRVLNFAQYVSSAMEASRKSRLAFTAAMSRFQETSNEDVVSSLRKALDYTFQDVEDFLRLVRVAMEAISR